MGAAGCETTGVAVAFRSPKSLLPPCGGSWPSILEGRYLGEARSPQGRGGKPQRMAVGEPGHGPLALEDGGADSREWGAGKHQRGKGSAKQAPQSFPAARCWCSAPSEGTPRFARPWAPLCPARPVRTPPPSPPRNDPGPAGRTRRSKAGSSQPLSRSKVGRSPGEGAASQHRGSLIEVPLDRSRPPKGLGCVRLFPSSKTRAPFSRGRRRRPEKLF